MKTNEAINLSIIAKTEIWKKFSENAFSKKPLSNPIKNERIRRKKKISQIRSWITAGKTI